ncbi:sulfotransferase [Hyphomonas sp. WL0036]|uniref:sulfotransferase family protein n=1 Tax=Hyphomonas sediminis TaxID=2866160 RepID=UPI001C81FA02|nr:sulfotransferase [Hyphomonas sediminis]MBY9068553.1 sulfotransferase [Hyphomonas sediminis]
MQGLRFIEGRTQLARFHWMISGVGRSGTTMAYSALLGAARAIAPDTLGRYEPFLWGAPTWDKFPEEFGDAFSQTDSISATGLYAHTQSPLFLDGSHPVHDQFIDEILPSGTPVVAKVIRGAGRLSAFLERDPDLKIVHLIRNPLDVVNSALLYFSFFGGEFHPSDEARFNTEAAVRFAGSHRPTADLTEVERTLDWWRFMNEAALQSASRFPGRLKIVPYEELMADLPRVMGEIASFLGASTELIDPAKLEDKVGPITNWISLRAVDRDAVAPFVDSYFGDARIFGAARNIDIPQIKARLLAKYEACKPGKPYVPQLAPNLAPTRVRNIANAARAEAETSRAAGEKQAALIVSKVSEATRTDLMETLGPLLAKQSDQIEAAANSALQRDVGIVALTAELSGKAKEIEELKAGLTRRDRRIADLEAKLTESQAAAKSADNDVQALKQLNSRLRDRVSSLQEQHRTDEGAVEKLRKEQKEQSEKLRKTEARLREVASEKERCRIQLTELAAILAPRMRNVMTLAPVRYVLRQRQAVKAGRVLIDENGVPVPK